MSDSETTPLRLPAIALTTIVFILAAPRMNDYLIYMLAVMVGMLAGVINTLAGSGSLVTLPMLIYLGLDGTIANATNRVGVLLGSATAATTFWRSGQLEMKGIAWLLVPTVMGAIGGAHLAAVLDAEVIHRVIGIVMVLMLGVIFLQPRRWLVENLVEPNNRRFSTVVIFFAIGAYGGFIQAGVGIFLLSGLVLYARYSLVQANALKVLLVLAMTVSAFVVFVYYDQIDWSLGLLMAGGQIVGSWLAATFATHYRGADLWIRRLLILVVIINIVKLFGLV